MTRTVAARLVRHGQPLAVEEVELPAPGPGEVLVVLSHGGVNPVDRYGAEGSVAPDGPLPRTLGMEAAGTVDGRPVLVRGHGLGTERDGVWAGAAVVPRAAVTALPDGVDPVQAAGMGVAGITAWRVVTELAGVTGDDRVLVLGASGGVGAVAVSVARGLGAEVWGQTGRPVAAKWITEHGATRAVVADAGELAAAVADLRPSVVVDPLGGGFTGAAIEAMSSHGRLVLLGSSADPVGEIPLRAVYRKGLTLYGYGGLIEPEDALAAAAAASLQALADGRLRVPVDAVLPLASVNDALARMASRQARGKLVLDLAGA